MLNIVLFGPPGSGKGTQAVKLAGKFNLVHLSTGDIFRANLKGGTELGLLAKGFIDKGELVPDEVTISILEKEVNKHDKASGFIFDGFPRTVAQAKALDEFLASKKTSVSITLALEVDEEELTRRILLRGKESGRSDDHDENIVRNRVKEYHTKTAPLKSYYQKQGKLKEVNGIGSIEEIFSILCCEINIENDDILIDYHAIIKNHPWVLKKNQKVIISPDADGVLCGLFMSHILNWEIVGYYDGKTLAVKRGIKPLSCVFLDMEIFRRGCKSIGQHMVLYNKNNMPENWNNFSNCINPNIIRGYDANKHFPLKYPLGTIHFLMCIIGCIQKIEIPKSAVTCLLYVDGTFKNLLNYPENCISWLKFLNTKNESSPLFPLLLVFAQQKIATMMHDLEKIFDEFRLIAGGKRGGDKIKLADIENDSFSEILKTKTSTLITFLSGLTEWSFQKEKWAMDGLQIISFNKGIIPINKLNNKNYRTILKKNPVSFAITGTKQMEYTLEKKSVQRKRKLW